LRRGHAAELFPVGFLAIAILPHHLTPDIGNAKSQGLGCRPTGSDENIEAVEKVAAPIARGEYVSVICEVPLDNANNRGDRHRFHCVSTAFRRAYSAPNKGKNFGGRYVDEELQWAIDATGELARYSKNSCTSHNNLTCVGVGSELRFV
jgi:hypothetical protein